MNSKWEFAITISKASLIGIWNPERLVNNLS